MTCLSARHEGIRISGCIDTLALYSVLFEMSGQGHAPAVVPPGKQPPVPTE